MSISRVWRVQCPCRQWTYLNNQVLSLFYLLNSIRKLGYYNHFLVYLPTTIINFLSRLTKLPLPEHEKFLQLPTFLHLLWKKKSPHNYGGFILHQKSCPTSRAKAQPTPHTTQALYQATEKIISKQETPHFDYILCTPTLLLLLTTTQYWRLGLGLRGI